MKISNETLDILNEFSKINNSMYIEAGNVIKVHPPIGTGSPTLKAVVQEEFPIGFGLGEIQQFLAVVKLFKNPDFDFRDKSVVISSSSRESTFRYSDKSTIEHPPYDKDINLKSIDIEFELDSSNLQDVIKSGKLLRMPHILFKGNGKNVSMQCYNKDLPSSQRDFQTSFSVDICESDLEFSSVFDANSLSFIKLDAKLSISTAGIAHFKMENIDMWVAAESVK